jgi:hypothetical protein
MRGEKLLASSTCPTRSLSVCEKEGIAKRRKAQKGNDLKKDIRDVVLGIPTPNAQENLMFVNSATLFDSQSFFRHFLLSKLGLFPNFSP